MRSFRRGNGLGNLIIGYNEDLNGPPNNLGSSHNLVIGIEHTYPNFGGLMAGFRNTISGSYASVSGGVNLTAKNESFWKAGALKQGC